MTRILEATCFNHARLNNVYFQLINYVFRFEILFKRDDEIKERYFLIRRSFFLLFVSITYIKI